MKEITNLKEFNLNKGINDVLDSLKEKEKVVLTGRCGLDGKSLRTLRVVGEKLSLTRERVRQIEKRAFEKLRDRRVVEDNFQPIASAFDALFEKYGGLVAQQNGIFELSKLVKQNEEPLFGYNIRFLLRASGFIPVKKSRILKPAWTSKKEIKPGLLSKIILEFEEILRERKKIIKTAELIDLIKKTSAYSESKGILTDNLILGIIYTGQHLIKVEEKDSWGLNSWPEINPKTIHDLTYYVVKKYGQPIHFTKIGELIEKEQRHKKFNVKTVHNVLIADRRFVLVGNGLYALKEWGYEPGTVYDVIVRILKKEGKPLTSQEITKRVLLERQVKPNTILVNLQNKDTFRRVKRATYTLISE